MSDNNPYESPGVVSDDAPVSDLIRQLEVRRMEWFLRANDGVAFMLFALAIAMGTGAALISFRDISFRDHEESSHWMTVGCAIGGVLIASLAWLQWRYHLAAMVVSGVLSIGTLLVVVGVVVSMAVPHVESKPRTWTRLDLLSESIALFAGVVFIAGWGYVVSLPLRVAAQAWTWRRQGIDVERIREEIHRRV